MWVLLFQMVLTGITHVAPSAWNSTGPEHPKERHIPRGGWHDWELYSFLSLSLHLYLHISIFVSISISTSVSIISIPGSSYLCHHSLVEPLLLCIEDGSKESKYGICVSPEVTHSFLQYSFS